MTDYQTPVSTPVKKGSSSVDGLFDGEEDYGLVPARLLKRMANDDVLSKKSNGGGGGDDDEEEVLRDTQAVAPRQKSKHELDQLLEHIDAIWAKNKSFLALVDNPLIQEWKRVLLRAEQYEVQRAAKRVEQQWHTKLDLFGSSMLNKKLKCADIPGLSGGSVQLLPQRDLAGRAIVCWDFDSEIFKKQGKEIRQQLYYVLACAFQDEETQDNGVTLIVLNRKPSGWSFLLDSFWWAWNDVKLPFPISRLHYCTINADAPYSCKESEDAITTIRTHQGPHQECLHAMFLYGIPSHALPFQQFEGMAKEFHNSWIQSKIQLDAFVCQDLRLVQVPSRHDILFSSIENLQTGTSPQSPSSPSSSSSSSTKKNYSPANIRYHAMLLVKLEDYHQGNLTEKNRLKRDLHQALVGKSKGRFLQQLPRSCVWEPLNETMSLDKIGHALDFLCRQMYDNPNNNDVHKKNTHDASSVAHHYLDVGDYIFSRECWNVLHNCDGSNMTAEWQPRFEKLGCWQTPTKKGKGLA